MNQTIPPVSERLSVRNQNHLSSSSQDLRKSHSETFLVELRKKKRRILSNIKRNFGGESIKLLYESSSLKSLITTFTDTESFILCILDLLYKRSPVNVLECFSLLDKALKSEELANIVLKSTYIGMLKYYLSIDDAALLVLTTSIFANLGLGDDKNLKVLVECHAIQRLICLTRLTEGEIQKNALWALCNMSKESESIRKLLVDLEVDKEIIQIALMRKPMQDKHFELLSHLSKLAANGEVSRNYVKIVYYVVREFSSEYPLEVHISAYWILFFLIYYSQINIDEMLKYRDLLPTIVQVVIKESNFELVRAASFNLSHVSGSTTAHTQRLLDCNGLEAVEKLIHSSNSILRKEGYFILSNIAAGVSEQIKAIFCYKKLIFDSFSGLFDFHFDVRKNAWIVFLNISKFKCKDFILNIAKKGLIDAIGKALQIEDNFKCLKLALHLIEYLISAAEIGDYSAIKNDLHENSIFEWVRELADHSNLKISTIADRILDSEYEYYD